MKYTGCRALTDEEIEKILAGMTGRFALRDRAIFVFGVRTGFRISEILSLKVGDIFENEAIKDVVTVAKNHMKGGEKSRSMPLHSTVKTALLAYIRAAKYDHPFHKSTAIFNRQGRTTAMSPAQFWAIIRQAAERSGVEKTRLGTHSMRKSFASKMWHSPRIGHDLLKMAKLLGHENPNNTARYVEFLDGSLEAAVLD